MSEEARHRYLTLIQFRDAADPDHANELLSMRKTRQVPNQLTVGPPLNKQPRSFNPETL